MNFLADRGLKSHSGGRGAREVLSKAEPQHCDHLGLCSATTLGPRLLLFLQVLLLWLASMNMQSWKVLFPISCRESINLQESLWSLVCSIYLWLQDQGPLLWAWNPRELWARAQLALRWSMVINRPCWAPLFRRQQEQLEWWHRDWGWQNHPRNHTRSYITESNIFPFPS